MRWLLRGCLYCLFFVIDGSRSGMAACIPSEATRCVVVDLPAMKVTSCRRLHTLSQALRSIIGLLRWSIDAHSPTLLSSSITKYEADHATAGRSGHPDFGLTSTLRKYV